MVVPPEARAVLDELDASNIAGIVAIRGHGQVDRALWERHRLGRLLERMDVDVVHGMKHLVPVTRLPTVLTVHDIMPLTWPQQFRLTKRLLLPRQFRRSLRDATVIVAASNTTAKRLALVDPAFAEKTVIAPNGVSVELQDVTPRAPAVVPDGPFALVVGDLSPRKNMSLLIDIWDRVSAATGGLRLVAVGPDGWRSAGTRRRLEALAARGSAVWARHVPDEELRWCYEHAQAVLVPTREEGFGLPVVEALMFGAPVIASTDDALVEVAQGRALHLGPDDETAWIDAIVATAHQTRAPLTPPALATWSEHADRTIDAYRFAIERAGIYN